MALNVAVNLSLPGRAPMGESVETKRRWWDIAGLVTLLGVGVTALMAIPEAGISSSVVFVTVTGSSQLVFAVLGLIFAIRAARLPSLPPRIRRAWRLMLPAYALWPLTIVGYAIFQGQAFPSPPDVLRLLIPVATLVGILSFAQWPTMAADRAKLRLDAGLVAVGSAMVLWYLVVSPSLSASAVTWREVVPSVVHPLAGTALLFGVGVVLLRGPQTAVARRPLLTIVAGTLVILSGDTVRAYVLNNGGPVMPSSLQSGLWTAGMFLLMFAPYVQARYARRTAAVSTGRKTPRTPRWPYLTVLPGYVLLLVTVGVHDPFPAVGLVAGALIVSTLAFARQVVSAQESRRLAVTDGLTGLANRVQLYEELPRALAKADRNGTRVGVLIIDMNGFKQVNDTLGHQAGDQLLVGFGHLLRRCVLGSDLVARLGGDEFTIVLPDVTDELQPQAVIRRIRAAMAEPIDVGPTVVQPSASIGMAMSEPGEQAVDELLNRADVSMYEAKKARARP
jgi:diguanylate cyclase (GGDEF)-like protein